MLSLICLLLLLLGAVLAPFSTCYADSGRKELRDKDVNQNDVSQSESWNIYHNRIDPSRVVQLSWQPRAFLYKGFLTDEECNHVISLAQGTQDHIARKSDESGEIAKNRLLATSESFSKDKILSRIEERISAWTFFRNEYGEPLHISRYAFEDAKDKFEYISNKSTTILNEPLMATVILYLSNVTRGGEILFPQSQLDSKVWSDCTKSSNLLRPVKGNAILFFNVHLNASPDKSSVHGRCPVLKGEMWCATKLFFVRSIDGGGNEIELDRGECVDEDVSCPGWAATGECERNPVFMIGSPDYYGTCRKSCNAC